MEQIGSGNVVVDVLIKACMFSDVFRAEEVVLSTQIGGTSLSPNNEAYEGYL
jgi:hypothetical protein